MIMCKMVFAYQNSKKGLFLYKQQDSKTKVAQFRVFELDMERSNSHRNVSPTV